MDDQRLIEDGVAGRLAAESPEFERFVEITARRPSGDAGAAHYRDPKEHEGSFVLALDALELTPDDRLLELCFGGGQLLERALETVPSAAGIDHSPDMLALAGERNADAVSGGRLELVHGDVHELPWPDGEFTCSACLNAFFFIERPEAFLPEVRRVLAPGGRFVLVTAVRAAAWNGPWAPALRTYEPGALRSLLLDAGFAEASVDESSGQQLAASRCLLHRPPGDAPGHHKHACDGERLLSRTGNRRELDGACFDPAADDRRQHSNDPKQDQ